jgi:hypothetical protein
MKITGYKIFLTTHGAFLELKSIFKIFWFSILKA